MLRPEYLDSVPEHMLQLYSQAEADIIADMARRISTYDYYIPAAEHQYKKLIEMGYYHDYILQQLSGLTGTTREEIETLMREASQKALKFDDEIYKAAGLSPGPLEVSPALQSVFAAGVQNTGGLFENLTRTTAGTASKQFENALDRAFMQIATGAFDKETSIRHAVKHLARNGVASVTYPSGRVDYIETAVRRAVVTGVNQTTIKMQLARAQEFGSDLVETTAHAGARPSHALWQGKVFSLSGNSGKYPNFYEATGYGTGPGLGGWYCRHSFYPYFEGLSKPAYTRAELESMTAKKLAYNGQQMTAFEASQKQRYFERQIRRWKREQAAMAAAEMDTYEAAAKITHWRTELKDFLHQTGLKRQTAREQIPR